MSRDLPVTVERRQHLLMAQILAPRLELFRRPAKLLAELREHVAEGVRAEILDPRRRERIAEDGADRPSRQMAEPPSGNGCLNTRVVHAPKVVTTEARSSGFLWVKR